MMDWIKKHYDLAILAAATLVLVANAALIFTNAQSEDASLATPSTAADKNALQEFQATILDKAKSAATNPTVWQFTDRDPSRASLLVSRKYLLKDGKLFDPIEGGENLHDPITNEWLIEYGLDYTAKDIKTRDADGDGFNNLEEFLAGKSPVDAASKPAGYNKLTLVDFKSFPFRIVFKGDPSGKGAEFQLNFLELKGAARTQYKKLGDAIEGAPYKIAAYKENKFTDDRGVPVDRSELTLENTDNGDSLVLVKDKQTDDPRSEGTFLNQITKETFVKKKGDTFLLKPDQIEFKIIDITSDSAQIQDTTTGQTYPISRAGTKNPQ